MIWSFPTIGYDLLQILALEELHGDKRNAIVFVDLIDGNDIGVCQLGRCLRFAVEALYEIWISSDLGSGRLNRNLPAQHGIFGPVNNTHGAAADLFLDFIFAKFIQHSEPACRSGTVPKPRIIKSMSKINVEFYPMAYIHRIHPLRTSYDRSASTRSNCFPIITVSPSWASARFRMRANVPFVLPKSSRKYWFSCSLIRA
jgi:hypothetical protein